MWLCNIFRFVQGTILLFPLQPSSCGLHKLSFLALAPSLHNPFHNYHLILDSSLYPNIIYQAQHNLSLVHTITRIFSAHVRLPICVWLPNKHLRAITLCRTPFTFHHASSIISIFSPSTIFCPQKHQYLLVVILYLVRHHLEKQQKQLLSYLLTTLTLTTITLAASKVGITFEKSPFYENDSNVALCKHLCRIPHPRTNSPAYKAWGDAMKGKMEQDIIPVWYLMTAIQWAAGQVQALMLQPVS